MSAFGYGLFLGAITRPCNPAFIASVFAGSFLFETPAANLLNFFTFGLGIGFLLFALAVASDRWSQSVIQFLTTNHSRISRALGAVMLVISIYYVFIVFDVLGDT